MEQKDSKNCCVIFLIDSLGTQRCTSSMTALPPKSSPRKKTCSHSLHSQVGTQSKVSGSSQRYISVLKDLREQAKWVCMFYTKDRDSFEYCLRENDVVPLEEKQKIKEELSKVKHRKLILKTDQPTGYWLMD